jgi:hypothetical protein
MAAEAVVRWRPCEDCDRVEASVFLPDAALCGRCVARREAGEPRKADVEAATARAATSSGLRYMRGYYNKEL